MHAARGSRRRNVMAEQHYDVTVNKADLSVRQFADDCNHRWADGWRLAHVFEKDGNTVSVWERRS
jgi:hypothetical protein